MRTRLMFGVLVALLATAQLFAAGVQEDAPREDFDQIVVALGAEPEALDPIAMASAPAATVSEHMTQPLVYMSPDGNLEPLLATSWEAAPDNLSWTLTLREGVTFHDGAPFNAEAVKMNLDRFLDPDNAAPFAFLLSEVSSIDVVDEYTVRISLNRPFAPIISHLSHSFVGMLSPRQIANQPAGEPVTDPVGTGPYRFVRWDRGSEIEMSVNENYFGDVPEIPTAIFRFIPEDAARVVALETGEVDAVMNIPPNQAERLGMNPNIRLEYPSSVRVLYVGFNTSEGPLADPRVRRALNLAVDKNAIVESVLQGTGAVSTAPIVPAVFGHVSAGPYRYNPAEARRLLAAAGYPNGFDVTFYHPTGRYPLDSTVAEAVQAYLAEVGIDAELVTLEWSSYLSALRVPPEDADADMYMLGWGTVTLDADYGLYALLHSSQASPAGWNVSYYANDRVDTLLSQARSNPDRDERAELYDEAITLIWQDAPWLYLHDVGTIDAYRADITGLVHHPLENLLVWDAEFVR